MLSGIKKVEYSTDSTGAFGTPVSLGAPLADSSGYTPEPQSVESGNGNQLYAGVKKGIDMNFDDLTKYAALETIMKADTPIWVKLTFMDDTTDTIISGGTCQVKKQYPFAVGKKAAFNLKAGYFAV